jgi:hypothetical protein
VKQNKGLTPYPMLKAGSRDFKKSKFELEIIPAPNFKQLMLEVHFNLDNEDILKDIQEKKLCFAFHIECPATAYRIEEKTFDDNITISISEKEIREKLEIHGFIIVNVPDYAYNNDDFDDFYAGNTFALHKGNIIADCGMTYTINDSYDDIEKLPSIIKVIAAEKPACAYDVILDNDNILIKLDKKLMPIYQELGPNVFRETFQTLILLPALEMVLIRVYRDPEEYEGYHWYEVLQGLFKKNDIDLTKVKEDGTDKNSVFALVQRILANPVGKAFAELEKFGKDSEV